MKTLLPFTIVSIGSGGSSRNSSNAHTAEAAFLFACWLFIFMGLTHGIGTVVTAVHDIGPFSPVDGAVRMAMEQTDVLLSVQMRGSGTSIWTGYIGFNFGLAMGLFIFGWLCRHMAKHDLKLLRALRLDNFAVGISAIYFMLSLRYLFYAPTTLFFIALCCFVLARFRLIAFTKEPDEP